MGAHFAGWPVASPIRPVPGVGCRGVCVGGGDMVFILDLHLPFCLALLYFYLLWLLKLSLLYLTPVAQYDSVAMLISIMSGPIREPWKNIIIFFTIRLDSVDSIFGYRFDFDFIGHSVFFQISQFRFRSGSDSKDFGYGYHYYVYVWYHKCALKGNIDISGTLKRFWLVIGDAYQMHT